MYRACGAVRGREGPLLLQAVLPDVSMPYGGGATVERFLRVGRGVSLSGHPAVVAMRVHTPCHAHECVAYIAYIALMTGPFTGRVRPRGSGRIRVT